jgi:uncharacterized protein YkwD
MRFLVFLLSVSLISLPAPQVEAPDVALARLEKRVFERVNEERTRRRLAALKLDPKLSDVARAHSADMAKKDYIAHVNKEGLNPTDRGHAAGYECRKVAGRYVYSGLAENIYQNNLYARKLIRGAQIVYEWNNEEKIAATSVSGWMGSPGHRGNILNSKYTETGIGIATSSDMKVYITQEFC